MDSPVESGECLEATKLSVVNVPLLDLLFIENDFFHAGLSSSFFEFLKCQKIGVERIHLQLLMVSLIQLE